MPGLTCLLVIVFSSRDAAAVRSAKMVDGDLELPEVAVCLAGAVRSLATMPVLRGLKKNVLQSPYYSASLFAALTYDTTSPQPYEYNASLIKTLSARLVVRRALAHLHPELKGAVFYNTSQALDRFRTCHATDARSMGTAVSALYGMQLCHALVRDHEAERGDQRFDWIVRIRPDHLFARPLPLVIGRNVSSWPRDQLLAPEGSAIDFAIVPSGPVAAVYFRTFTAATSCLFRQPNGAESLPAAFPKVLQCSRLAVYDNFAYCVLGANLRYHALPAPTTCRRPALLARICNANRSTRLPIWPASPMPAGETCITWYDMLKRPKGLRAGATDAGSTAGGARSSGVAFDLTAAAVLLVMLGAAMAFRQRILDDGRAIGEMVSPFLQPYLGQAIEAARPAVASANEHLEALQGWLSDQLSARRGY